jgi:hypothetical protein
MKEAGLSAAIRSMPRSCSRHPQKFGRKFPTSAALRDEASHR